MEITERRQADILVLSPTGRLDAMGAPMLEARLIAIGTQGKTQVALDCTGVEYIASTGLRALLNGTRACRKTGGTLVLCALRTQCREVIIMSGFGAFIDCHEHVEEAIAALGRAQGADGTKRSEDKT